MKLFIAIPTYDSKTHIGTTTSLAAECALAAQVGVPVTISFQPGMALVHSARNLLCQRFLESDATHLMFIDADCGWDAGAVIQLCMKPGDVVAGACRRRKEPESYAISWLDKTIARDDLLEVEAIGMAFTCIKREALERFKRETPERAYANDGESLHAFFDSPVRDGYLWGEDMAFCLKWRELGGCVLVDPNVTLRHLDGLATYEGTLSRWLVKQGEDG